MSPQQPAAILLLASVLVGGPAAADGLQSDHPTDVDGIKTVCTGTSLGARANPQWRDYSLKLEFVGVSGEYLGDETVNVSGRGKSVVVHCDGPWVLMNLPKGRYQVAANVANAGHQSVTASVPAAGQARVVVRFPNAGYPAHQAPPVNKASESHQTP